ncbi:MAG: rpsB, partial [Planctomycetaceae bacterium]|nr:rpsB [Planctomycetaceae bacterium]
MAEIVIKDILEAGVHFGHRCSRWNPKMRPYIHGKRNLIHIIDIKETVRGLLRAKKYLQQVASQGSLILFVGTKRQAADPIQQVAEHCGMPYVKERWLGGTLTNFRTIRSRLKRLEELENLDTTGAIATYSKKRQSTLHREFKKIHRNLSGMRDLNRLPEALIVVDPRKEGNAVKE